VGHDGTNLVTGEQGRQAVVLSGGGANGAYEVGVLKALLAGEASATDWLPLQPEVFAATSVGAFNAALMVSQASAGWAQAMRDLEDVWINDIPGRACNNRVFRYRADLLDLLDLNCVTSEPEDIARYLVEDFEYFARDWFARAVNFATSAGSAERRFLELIDLSTLISGSPGLSLVNDTIAFAAIRRSPYALRVVATQWRTGDVKVFANADMTDEWGARILLASAAIPGIFPPVQIAGETYVDGGVVLNTPLAPAIEAGADVLHAVYLDPDVAAVPIRGLRNTLDTISRMTMIGFAATMNRDIEVAQMINKGLEVIQEVRQGAITSTIDHVTLSTVAANLARGQRDRPLRRLTIHRYHPKADLTGPTGVLDFSRKKVAELIDYGFNDAVEHDCNASGCVVPQGHDDTPGRG
jgi:predicted acylesterase/phospholipase RssA